MTNLEENQETSTRAYLSKAHNNYISHGKNTGNRGIFLSERELTKIDRYFVSDI